MGRHLDFLEPFMIDQAAVRGRLVRMGPSLHEILTKHDYPDVVSQALGRFLLLGSCLSHAFKFDGILTLQVRGNGPIGLLVADMESSGNLRGYAQYQDDALGHLTPQSSPADLFGQGHFILTIDPGKDGDMYQGVVPLEGENLEACLAHFFLYSDQIQVDFHTALDRVPGDDGQRLWQGGMVMLQKMPPLKNQDADDAQEDFDRCRALTHTLTQEELLNAFLSPHDLLFRLFHEEGVRVFDPLPLHARCRCSREKVEKMLASMQSNSLEEYVIDGKIDITCQFCNSTYVFEAGQFSPKS